MAFFSPILARRLRLLEEALLSAVLLGMIALSMVQIILRLFFDSGLLWGDPLLRYLVVWGGFLGAVLAVAQEKHICLDLIGNMKLPVILRSSITLLIRLFAATVCVFLTYASYLFIVDEFTFGSKALFSIASWIWNLIFPLAFAGMALRYFCAAISAARVLLHSAQTRGAPKNDRS